MVGAGEVQCVGRSGCRLVHSIVDRHHRNQAPRHAIAGQTVIAHVASNRTHPFSLVSLAWLIHHFFSHAVRVPERPDCELMQDSDLSENVEIPKPLGFFVVTIRIEVGSLGQVLSPGIFIPDVIAAIRLAKRKRL